MFGWMKRACDHITANDVVASGNREMAAIQAKHEARMADLNAKRKARIPLDQVSMAEDLVIRYKRLHDAALLVGDQAVADQLKKAIKANLAIRQEILDAQSSAYAVAKSPAQYESDLESWEDG